MDFLYNNFLADFFTLCMQGLNRLFHSYPASIITLTILIRLALLPLDLRQRANQQKMAAIGPEIQSLQKRYANNPQQLQRKQQELYRKRGARPMAGCLPMLIQLPILFAFFGAMRLLVSEQSVALMLNAAQYGPEAVTLPSFLWVHNFWQPDSGMAPILMDASQFMSYLATNASVITPETMQLLHSQNLLLYTNDVVTVNTEAYNQLANGIIAANGKVGLNNGWFVLPALSGAALFLQQKFAPSTAGAANPMMPATTGTGEEQAQAQGCSNKVMMWVFPIFSIYICVQNNAAFALYWFASSLYAFAQMQVVNLIKKLRAKKQNVIVT